MRRALTETERLNRYRVPAVEMAVRILKQLKRHPGPLPLSEISQSLKVNKSTCYGVLKTLQQHGLVSYDEPSKRYSLGLALMGFGGVVGSRLDALPAARPLVRRLAEDLGLTSYLAQRLDFKTGIIVERVEHRASADLSIPLGQQVPITAGAMGKCFLAHLPEPEVERLLSSPGLRPFTARSIVDVHRYQLELKRVRETGWAESVEESLLGHNAVASPVFDAGGQVGMVLGLIGSNRSMPEERMAFVGREVKQAAETLTPILQGRSPACAAG